MSKISQELKVLLYLNQRYVKDKYISISEIARYLEVSDRQARRYLEDLNNMNEISVKTKHGRNGGYRLKKPLDKSFSMPENLLLAMSIAMRRDEDIEKILALLPHYVMSDMVVGDHQIDNDVLDNLEVIIMSIKNKKRISFIYDEEKNVVEPYKVVLTNHSYYLFGIREDEAIKYDVSLIKELKQLKGFRPNKMVVEELDSKLKKYGIKNGKETILRVKCINKETLLSFDKHYEGKGTIDFENLTYTVIGNSETELYYTLIRINTKKYQFIDEEFKNKYLAYLEKQVANIKAN